MKKLYLLTTILAMLFAQLTFAQGRTVTGTVTDVDTSEPLVGVNVRVAGTVNGTVTDFDGKYSVTLPQGYKALVFSFVGYENQEVVLDGASNIVDISMAPGVALDEVVVTALGISKEKRALGYSVTEVGGEDLTRSQEVNMVSALSGKVAGVQVVNSSGAPGASSFIRIRGNTSITGSNQPLFVVDGVPVDNSQDYSGNPDDGDNNLLDGVAYSNRAIDLNPDDIESVSVLKSAAASVLYGIKGANGVVLITTKKGKNTGGKLDVSFNTSIAFEKVNKLPELQTKYAQGEDGLYMGPESGTRYTWGPLISELRYDGDDTYLFDRNGRLVLATDDSATDKPANVYDNLGDFFRTGITNNTSVSVAGGSEDASFRFTLSNAQTKGIIPTTKYRRTSAKIFGETALTSKLKVSSSVTYTNSGGDRAQQGSNVSGVMLGLLRTSPTFDNSNGNDDASAVDAYEMPDGTQRNYRGGPGYDNPYWTVNKNPFTDNVNRMFGFAKLEYAPLDWLSFTYRFGNDFYSDRRKQVFSNYSNQFTNGQIANDELTSLYLNSDFFVNINKALTDKLDLGIMVGHNWYRENFHRLYAQGDGLDIIGFDHLSNAGSFLVRESTNRLLRTGVFGQLDLAFDRMLYLSLTGRNEWSSTLPSDSRSFFYPSATLGFVFTEALGLSDSDAFPFGKLRLSFAQVGSDAGVYGTKTYFQQSAFADGWTDGISYPFMGQTGFTQQGVAGNPDLKPETTQEYEAGLDLRFWKGRIGMDVTYYNKRSKDVILAVPTAASSGFRGAVLNAAEISNQGVELSVDFTPVKVAGFQWDITYNFSKNISNVEKLAVGVENVNLGGFAGTSIRAIAGEPYGVIFGGKWLRDENGNVVIESDPDGNFGFPVTDPNTGVIGDPNPDWLSNIRNTFSWKGLSLTALLDIKKGGDLWNGTKGALVSMGTAKDTENRGNEIVVFEGIKGTTAADGTIITDGETNNIGVVLDEAWFNGNGGGFGPIGELFVEDASYVRLRELSLSYDFGRNLLKKGPVRGLSLSLTGRNVFLITNYDGVDPDTSLTGADNAQGMDYFQMPNTKGWTIGLNVNF